MENKTSKYFKYAIGEIVLVVIGILIALQINNWNESRKQDIAEIEFLKGVKSDLLQDKAYMASVLTTLNAKKDAFERLNEDLSKDETEAHLKSYLFVGNYTFYPISGAFQSALSGNDINTFKSKSIISILVKLYNSTYPRLLDNANQLDARWQNLSEKYKHERRVGSFDLIADKAVSEIKDDIYFHYIQLEFYKRVLKSTMSEIDEVLKKIDD